MSTGFTAGDVARSIRASDTAQEIAKEWCDDRCGIPPLVAQEFASWFATKVADGDYGASVGEIPYAWEAWLEDLLGCGMD